MVELDFSKWTPRLLSLPRKLYYRLLPLTRYDTNPYNYKCRICGQYYITLGKLGTRAYDYLESSGDILNHKCYCHKYVHEDLSWYYRGGK